jgi:hypothetical protein
MKITTKVTFKQYVKLLYGLTYQRPIMKVLLGVSILIIIWIIFYYLNVIDLPEPVIYQYITLALILGVQPIVIFTTIRTVYYSSNHICQTLEMDILPQEIKVQGESFYMEVRWEKMFKIIEKPKWFLIYQNSLSAIIIPKKDLQAVEINEIREILKKLTHTKVELLDL